MADKSSNGHRTPLYLASASPRRRKILEQIGVSFRVHVTEVKEAEFATDPRRTVRTNALAKWQATTESLPEAAIIAADTVLEFDGRCVGKPLTLDEARQLFAALSGHSHDVLTAVCMSLPRGESTIKIETSTVRFQTLQDREIEAYFQAVNPLDKAGGYDIDQSGEMIIESFTGSRTNVMGLPIEVVQPWLIQQQLL